MSLFKREPKTEDQVREAVNKAVQGASVEMSSMKDTRNDVEKLADNIPTLAAGVAAVETVVTAGKEIFDTTKDAAVSLAVEQPEVEQSSGVDFDM